MAQEEVTLERSLDNAANVLRSKMDANEYKNYTLGTIFYKYLSDSMLYYVAELLEEKNISLEEAQKLYEENQKFEIGKAIQLGNGTDGTVFATGVTVSEAIKAQEELSKIGIEIRVVDIHTIKPIDEETIIKCAKETKKLISIEDHNIIGGLGSAIAEVLSEKYPTKLIRMGINDTFGKSGKAEELMKYFKITAKDIIELFN